MRTSERKGRGVVIKSRGSPVRRRVADRAICWEAGCDVIWAGSSGKVRLVASVTSRGQSQIVIVGMASCASYSRMRAGERERRGVVIEARSSPVSRGVAGRAGGGETRCDVRRRVGTGVIGLVARVAIGRNRCVIVICVALYARQRGMGAGEREDSCVIEGRCRPRRRGVAQSAISGKAGSNVLWIVGSSEISLMAAIAGGRQCCVVVIGMALRASNRGVRTGQWE